MAANTPNLMCAHTHLQNNFNKAIKKKKKTFLIGIAENQTTTTKITPKRSHPAMSRWEG